MKAKTALERSTVPTKVPEIEAQMNIITYFAKKLSTDLKTFFQTTDSLRQHAEQTDEWIEQFRKKNAR